MKEERIPRIIHYCWFGHGVKNKKINQCIRSWAKYCKDYKVIEWNEDNFIISEMPNYVQDAYRAKKWAFVSDFARLWILYNHGGIYMDTDVELLKPIDEFLIHDAFSGFESSSFVPTGIMGSIKNHQLIYNWLSEYDEKPFILIDGSYNTETNTVAITRFMKAEGLILDNSFQIIKQCAFYPSDWFCPKNWDTGEIIITKNTYAIHHFTMTWLDKSSQEKIKKERRNYKWGTRRNNILQKILGKKLFEELMHLYKKQKRK